MNEFLVPEIKLTPELIYKRSFVFFGETNSGKSFIIKHCIDVIHNHIQQVFVVAPTDPENKSYTGDGYIPSPFVRTSFELSFLKTLWERQESMVSTYTNANDKTIIKELFNMIPNKNIYMDYISKIERAKCEKSQAISDTIYNKKERTKKIENMEKIASKMTDSCYKKAVKCNSKNIIRAYGKRLPKQHEIALKYIDFDPSLLLILDDCGSELNKACKEKIFTEYFYQGRHKLITLFIACQSQDDLKPNCRRNAHYIIFTSPIAASNFFNSAGANGISSTSKKKATKAIEDVFNNWDGDIDDNHWKLLYKKEGCMFYRIWAKPPTNGGPGNKTFREFGKYLEKHGGARAPKSKFSQYFD